MGTATALRLRTTLIAAPTRPTQHVDSLLKFDFSGNCLAKPLEVADPETKISIKDAITRWLEQQL